ncbi:MAG: cell surface protein SprA, partial [Spirosomataceae bacterium]
ANSPNPPKLRYTRAPGDEESFEKSSNSLLKSVTRLLMTVRGINFSYSQNESTILPGFLPSPTFFGMDRNWANAPGLPFVLGSQSRDIHVRAAENGWLSRSIIQNDPFTQSIEKRFEYNTNLEPFKGFRMSIRGNLARGDSYQELYRPNETGGAFESLNPLRNGTFRMSFWSFKTGFVKMSKNPEDNYDYEIFNRMVDYREVVQDRLYAENPNAENGFYDINSQDVLIASFFAAYSGKDPREVRLNPFLRFPLPNWRVDFTGVEKILGIDRAFSSITINHSYTSTYNVGNFTSSLEYGAQNLNLLMKGYPLGFLTNQQALFIPVFVMSTITMEERYAPFIGVQFTTKKSVTGRVEYNKERRAGLNLSNSQVAEYSSDDIVVGIGFKRNNIRIPIRGADGNQIVLKNDLNFRFDVTLRDIIALQRRLDGDAVVTQGNYNLQIRPQVQYQFNKRFSGSFYIERLVNNPYNSLSFYRSSTIGGVNVRFNLAE